MSTRWCWWDNLVGFILTTVLPRECYCIIPSHLYLIVFNFRVLNPSAKETVALVKWVWSKNILKGSIFLTLVWWSKHWIKLFYVQLLKGSKIQLCYLTFKHSNCNGIAITCSHFNFKPVFILLETNTLFNCTPL